MTCHTVYTWSEGGKSGWHWLVETALSKCQMGNIQWATAAGGGELIKVLKTRLLRHGVAIVLSIHKHIESTILPMQVTFYGSPTFWWLTLLNLWEVLLCKEKLSSQCTKQAGNGV